MLKDITFKHVSISSHAKKWYIWEVKINKELGNIPTHLIISLTRPKVDEDQIRTNVTYRHQEKLKQSLFSKELRKQIEKEVKEEIEQTKKVIREMANPVIFESHLSEYNDKTETKIVFKVHKDVWLYLFKRWVLIEKLFLNLDTYPEYIRWEQEVKKIVDEFIDNNEGYFDTKKLIEKGA